MEACSFLNKVKLSDRTDLFMPKNTCNIPILNMTPEHSLRNLALECDHQRLAEEMEGSAQTIETCS